MKLLENTESEITKNKNGENLYDLKITEVALVHCNIIENVYQQIEESWIHLFLISCLVN